MSYYFPNDRTNDPPLCEQKGVVCDANGNVVDYIPDPSDYDPTSGLPLQYDPNNPESHYQGDPDYNEYNPPIISPPSSLNSNINPVNRPYSTGTPMQYEQNNRPCLPGSYCNQTDPFGNPDPYYSLHEREPTQPIFRENFAVDSRKEKFHLFVLLVLLLLFGLFLYNMK